ncbi:hypothetical protein IDH44_15030 [Paenibacillus sp. IB182496]|uniref:Sensory transduction regulator n=1 Tax=Paenibacillus sabuli TaxID=2772509 RepID=A0A927GSF6_9BACL|nr:hypothetical protein [Paenibacillus sabuli]MBD2846513.1 hypothetical protein [Paenibacillus sabuli]
MISEQEHAKQLAELGGMQLAFQREGFQSELLERTPDIPLHVLLLPLGKDAAGRDRIVNLNFQPLPDSDIEWIRLLQMYTTVPCDIAEGRQSDVEHFLHVINGRIPLGYFGIQSTGEIYVRYVCSVPSSSMVSSDELLEVLSIFHYVLEMFPERIQQLASGDIALADALQALNR